MLKFFFFVITLIALNGCFGNKAYFINKSLEIETAYQSGEVTKGEYLILRNNLEAEKRNFRQNAYIAMQRSR